MYERMKTRILETFAMLVVLFYYSLMALGEWRRPAPAPFNSSNFKRPTGDRVWKGRSGGPEDQTSV